MKAGVKEYSQAEMGDPDLKLIICGDTASGKSKYYNNFKNVNN